MPAPLTPCPAVTPPGTAVNVSTLLPAAVVALVNHNLSDAATWRVLLGTSAGEGDVHTMSLQTWLHADTDATFAAAGMDDGEYLRDWRDAQLVLSSFKTARYVTVEISDEGNPDGYVQIGRLFAGGGFLPKYGADVGFEQGWIDLSTKDSSDLGSDWINAKRRIRSVRMVLSWLSPAEGDAVHEMQRMLGTIDETYFWPDINDPAHSQRYGMLAKANETARIKWPYPRTRALPLDLTERA